MSILPTTHNRQRDLVREMGRDTVAGQMLRNKSGTKPRITDSEFQKELESTLKMKAEELPEGKDAADCALEKIAERHRLMPEESTQQNSGIIDQKHYRAIYEAQSGLN